MFDVKELLPQNIANAAGINKRTTKISIKHRALPLILAYSMTTHKSQGQTLGKIITDLVMPPGPTELSSVCVALSLIKQLDESLIILPLESTRIQVKLSKTHMEELKRLDLIAQKARKHFPLSV